MKTRDIYCGQPSEVTLFKQAYSTCLYDLKEKPFRNCKASVGYASVYIYLRSYNTVVAFIDPINKVGYDILRTEYGYTATSAQHIAKFFKEYDYYVGTILRTDYKNGHIITKVLY